MDKGYLPDIKALTQNNTFALNIVAKTFTVTTDVTQYYQQGRQFNIFGSTLNNGIYTVVSSIFTSGNTTITVIESIPSSTVDGYLSIYTYYDDPNGVILYKSQFAGIIATKGFAVEVFGVGADRAKYQKKIPRIVIVANQTLPGALGGAPDKIYTPIGSDPLAPTSYTAEVLPPQTVDYTYDIRLAHSTAQQSRVLHGITSLALPPRGYIKWYNDSTKQMFVQQFSFRNIPDPSQNIEEDVYMYRVEDIFESENSTVGTGIIPITQIDVDIEDGLPGDSIQFGDTWVNVP